jgi:hypothetical protein
MTAAPTSERPFAGVIAAEYDPPGIDRKRWLALIGDSDHLRPSSDGADEASAAIVIEGTLVGQIRWSTTANELDVHGELERVADVAWNVAASLGGQFVTLAELTRC